MASMQEIIFYRNLRGNVFHPRSDSWYNLDTETFVSEIPSGSVKCHIAGVCGSSRTLDYFCWVNHPERESDNIKQFDLAHWFKYQMLIVDVTNIVDGDTFDVKFFLSLNDIPGLLSFKGVSLNGGFLTTVRLRLAHCDVAEKDTPAGKAAIVIVKDLFTSVNNRLVVKINKMDMYNRYLADVFLGSEKGTNLCQYLLDYNHPKYGKIALPYEGKKKTPFPVFQD